MKRKKRGGGGGGANWMDTYGDMVTLLLCFFVLLYSMSTIDEEKWKALVVSFNPNAVKTETVTSGNKGPNADPDTHEGDVIGISQEDIDQAMDALYETLKAYVAEQNAENTISVTRGDGKVFVSFNETVFFDPDDWALREESKPVLEVVGGTLSSAANAINEVRVIGHTAQGRPDKPNNPTVDRLLSAQRAANVLAYVQVNTTLDAARMISEGCGQWRPVADNSTPEGRAKNRRVEMIISGRNLQDEIVESIQQYWN